MLSSVAIPPAPLHSQNVNCIHGVGMRGVQEGMSFLKGSAGHWGKLLTPLHQLYKNSGQEPGTVELPAPGNNFEGM